MYALAGSEERAKALRRAAADAIRDTRVDRFVGRGLRDVFDTERSCSLLAKALMPRPPKA